MDVFNSIRKNSFAMFFFFFNRIPRVKFQLWLRINPSSCAFLRTSSNFIFEVRARELLITGYVIIPSGNHRRARLEKVVGDVMPDRASRSADWRLEKRSINFYDF